MDKEVKIMEGQLNYPPNVDSIKSIAYATDWFLKDKIFDLLTLNINRHFTEFASKDDWTETQTGSTSDIGGVGIILTTGTTTNDYIQEKRPTQWLGEAPISFKYRSMLMTDMNIASAAATNQTIYCLVGDLATSYYGFKVLNATLYGVAKGGTGEQTVSLGTVSVATNYTLKAIYNPGTGTMFYVNGVGLGRLTAETPLTSAVTNIFTLKISTEANASKSVRFGYVDFLQIR